MWTTTLACYCIHHRSFADYVSCMERARDQCENAGRYTCTIMSAFSTMYGTYICDVDIEPWVAKDIRACKVTFKVTRRSWRLGYQRRVCFIGDKLV